MSIPDDIYYFGYVGSKRRLMPKLVAMFPDKSPNFFEGCGGSGYISLNLPLYKMPVEHKQRGTYFPPYMPFKTYTYNETNTGVYLLFDLMKRPETREALIERLPNIEWSEAYFNKCSEHYNAKFAEITDDIEKAVMTFSIIVQSRYNGMKSYLESKSLDPVELRQRLESVANAIARIEVSNLDCFDLIKSEYENSKSFIYLDPPYMGQNRYAETWSFSKHAELAELCKDAKCKIMISSGSNVLYDEVLAKYKPRLDKWHKYYVGSFLKTQADKGSNDSYYEEDERYRDEYVYTNYEITANTTNCDIREYELFTDKMRGYKKPFDEKIKIKG